MNTTRTTTFMPTRRLNRNFELVIPDGDIFKIVRSNDPYLISDFGLYCFGSKMKCNEGAEIYSKGQRFIGNTSPPLILKLNKSEKVETNGNSHDLNCNPILRLDFVTSLRVKVFPK